MKANFAKVMAAELKFEGGKVDDDADPGGRTNQGIIQTVYSAWRLNNDLPPQDVYKMSDAERDAIYTAQYWAKVKGDDLPDGLDLVVMDGAVHSGVVQSVKWLQRGLGSVYTGKIDGVMGEATYAAIKASGDVSLIINAVLDRRLIFLKALKTYKRFGRGWENRIGQVRAIGLDMANGLAHDDPVAEEPGMGEKAVLADARKAPQVIPGGGTIGAGATVAATTQAATSWLDSAKTHVTSLGTGPHITAVLGYIDHAKAWIDTSGWLVGGAIVVGGGAWLWWAKREAARLHDALDTAPLAPAPSGNA